MIEQQQWIMTKFFYFQRCQQQEGMRLSEVTTAQMSLLGSCESYVATASEAILIELAQLGIILGQWLQEVSDDN